MKREVDGITETPTADGFRAGTSTLMGIDLSVGCDGKGDIASASASKISGLTEMEKVMEPLLADVALHNACEEYGQRVHGKEKLKGAATAKRGNRSFSSPLICLPSRGFASCSQ